MVTDKQKRKNIKIKLAFYRNAILGYIPDKETFTDIHETIQTLEKELRCLNSIISVNDMS